MGCTSSKNAVADPQPLNAGGAEPPKVGVKDEPVPIVEDTTCKICGSQGKDSLGKRCSCSIGQALAGPPLPLKVTIVSARGLRNADWVGKSDPYCIFEVSGKPESLFKTKIINNNLNPEWNHEADVGSYCVGNSLTFKVKDSDVVKTDDPLGEVTLTTTQFFENGFDGEVQLSGAGTEHGSFLTVRIELLHPQVTITIVSARNLRNADWIGKSDPYCICEIPGRKESRFETVSIKDQLEPEWNHETKLLGYHVEDFIDFTIKDKDPVKPDDYLGKVTLTNDQILPDGFSGELRLLNTGEAGRESFLTVKVVVGDKPEPEEPVEELNVAISEIKRPEREVQLDDKVAPRNLCC